MKTAEQKKTEKPLTMAEWQAEGEKLFGADSKKWRFVCPSCEHVATTQDWIDAGAPRAAIAFSCVGRWLDKPADAFVSKGKGPCNYAGGGLFCINTKSVEDGYFFEFAPVKT